MTFNDEPFDHSIVIHALSNRQRQRVVEADTPRFWNLTWSVIGDPSDGTFDFDNELNLLDQFLVNKNMARQNGLIRAKAEVEIRRFPGTFTAGRYHDRGRSVACASLSTRTALRPLPNRLQVTEADSGSPRAGAKKLQ